MSGVISGTLSPTGKMSGKISIVRGGSSSGSYEDLFNKPKIEGVVLVGDKTFEELGVKDITPQEIDEIIYGGE